MTKDKQPEFKLSEDLEGMIKNVGGNKQLLEATRSDPNDLNLRRSLARQYEDERLETMQAISVLDLVEAKVDTAYKNLNERLDDKLYGEAKNFYMDKIVDEPIKMGYYVNLLSEGISPKKPSNELQAVIQRVQVAKAIKEAINLKKLDEAESIAVRYLKESKTGLTREQSVNLKISRLYEGRAFIKGRADVLEDIASERENEAARIIKEKDLYAEIEAAVPESQYGKAKSLMGMYQAYAGQQQYTEAKNKAAEAEKAKKGK